VAWNFRGTDSSSFVPPAAGAAPAPAAAAASAPAAAKPSVAVGGGIGDLKSELKMDNAAAGLKKVTKDMQTWRADYKGGDAPKPTPKVAPRPVVVKTKGTHMVEFKKQGMRWCVEAQTKDDGVVEVVVEDPKHSVAIYGCFQATIDIKGKCKGVTLDSCEQTQVFVDTVLSSVELVNCKRMKVQIREMAPTVAIDKTDGCQVFLSKDGLETGFTTAKSSEMNVSFPDPKTGDLIETPIPEQFVHRVILGDSPHMSADVSDLYTH
jgi:adenylyl cyclase-associated protein